MESPQIEEPSTFTLQQHGGPATRPPKRPPSTDATITMPIDFLDLPLPALNIICDEPEPKDLSPANELLHWHYKLGHVPFKVLQQMAHKGELLHRLAQLIPPFCGACKYGKQMKKPWHRKGQQSYL